MTSEPERYGEHNPTGLTALMPLGERVIENPDGERPLDVYARYDEYDDGGAVVVLYQGGDVIALGAEEWDAFATRVREVILNGGQE